MIIGDGISKEVVLFGTGAFAEVVDFYLSHDSDCRVVGFTETANRLKEKQFRGRPVVAFEDVARRFPPESHAMFMAMGYRKLNLLRRDFFEKAKAMGYLLLSYVCSRTTWWGDSQIGENVFVFEDNTIQPFVSIGDDTIVWSGNHIGHHTAVGAHCFVSSHVVISGYCRIGSHCFLGVNSTIAEGVCIGERNIVGPGALIQKDTGPGEVYLAERAKKFPKDSSWFMK
jgi:sugar O-acyltransferase (sialic acid O-acetyltransferase NeuD family)